MDEKPTRLVNPETQIDDRLDLALRPHTLTELIGQERVKENLAILIAAARQRGDPLDHVLFYGPPGLGKTTLAHVLANEMQVNIKVTSGPAIERCVEEVLYPAMEDYALDIVIGKGPSARSIRLKLPRFTVIGATTRVALLSAPLRSRFGAVYHLDFYDIEAMRLIVVRACKKLSVHADDEGVDEVAQRGRGTPRVALRLLRRVRDYAQVRADGRISRKIAQDALELLNVDLMGLDELDRRVLLTVIEKYRGGPVGLSTIAASISEEPDTIMDVVEPYLLQLGYLERTSHGRVATALAYEHLGIAVPSEDQQKLF
jgi:Holliday junction DNA helicase RuvB